MKVNQRMIRVVVIGKGWGKECRLMNERFQVSGVRCQGRKIRKANILK